MAAKGGSVCAIATCTNYSAKIKSEGSNISFHRFPKDPAVQKKWVKKCKRADSWNPNTAYICSNHFNSSDFVHNFKDELLGGKHKRRLLPGVLPTLNLPCVNTSSVSASNRKNRMETKLSKQSHDQTIAQAIEEKFEEPLTECHADPVNEYPNAVPDYEMLYKNLLKENEILKSENYKLKEESLKKPDTNYKTINESLRFNMKFLQNNLNKTNLLLKQTQTKMSKELKMLSQTKIKDIETTAKQYLSLIFSPNQVDIIMKKKKRVNWSKDEISKAFTLRYLSKRAYIYVKNELKYPLPGLSSLQRWAKSIDMRNGILHEVLKIMSINASNLKSYEKLAVLMFDEVKVACTMEYDVLHDQVLGPHNQMQVIMARGIASPWKQPVMIDFDTKMSKSILFNIIQELDQIGYTVICCVCDCGGGNVGLWKELGVNYEQPIFNIPSGRKIVCVPDAPHLLKLTRNWLLDTGFYLNDKVINKEPLEALITMMSAELSVCHKLSSDHLTCEGPQRQKVKLATQLLSHTTATALKHYKPISNINLNDDTANFIELINNWFDLANVSHPNNNHTPFKAPYGTFLEEQDSLLNQVYNIIFTMRCKGKNCLQMFQKGILMYINGTRYLLEILKEYDLNYLLTSKINQDALENLFSQIRSRGGLNDHPTPLNALYRLRMIVLGKNPGITCKSNTYDNNNEEFLLSTMLRQADIIINDNDKCVSDTNGSSDDETLNTSNTKHQNQNEMINDAVEYLIGWVAKKYRTKYPELGSTTSVLGNSCHDYTLPTWVQHLSYGGLIVPSSDFKKLILRCEKLFIKFTKGQIPKGRYIVRQLTNKIYNRVITDEKYKILIQTYIKQRVIIRMKYFNQNLISMQKIKKSKMRLQRLNKLRKTMT